MKTASDSGEEWIALVRSSYNECADAYVEQRSTDERELEILAVKLNKSDTVLDVGCGAGVPVTLHLSNLFRVTGVDISDRMIERAKSNVKNAQFIRANILETDFAENSYDAVVSYYALFHIPRKEQPHLFQKFFHWIKPGGYILASPERPHMYSQNRIRKQRAGNHRW